MKLTVMTTTDERILQVEAGIDELVENVKAILEVETSISIAQQRLLHNGKELNNYSTLRASNLSEGDLLQLESRPGPTSSANATALRPDGSAVDPIAFQRHLQANRSAIAILNQRHPELGQQLLNGTPDQFQSALRELFQLQAAAAQGPPLDPMDPEYQRRIEEEIKQKNIAENLEVAYEYNPAHFFQVQMLYVEMEVNNHPLKAFIDSGAQMTIMSDHCAERVGIMRLCDKRYAGVAVGVGQGKIVGRIHNVQLKIGTSFYMCGITVLESSSVEFIFGLDMLKRHRCSIDLEHNLLRVSSGEVDVPFLTGNDAPSADSFGQAGTGAGGSSTVVPQERTGPTTSNAVKEGEAGGAVQAAPSSSDSDKIERLIALGFPRVEVVEALAACGGNEEYAAGVLFGG